MAKRPVFISIDKYPYCEERIVDFTYYSGFSVGQKQRCIDSLHESYARSNKISNARILEVSTKSKQALGVKLSAFNLTIKTTKSGFGEFSVESAFQGSKVFENGGPFADILQKSSKDAKKDERIRNSGRIIGFQYFNRMFPNAPITLFYNWLYINALSLHPEYHEELLQYDVFTDIEFNRERSKNCQANAVSIFVSLKKMNLLEDAIRSKEEFLRVVYEGAQLDESENFNQISFL